MLKEDSYRMALAALSARLAGEKDFIANMANTAAVLNANMENINWAGFYLFKEGQLVLGPFQGKAAVTRIDVGKGVCGTAFIRDETLLVPDVHAFPGHIACDARSRSEIVVPMHAGGSICGVLDIDSPINDRFDGTDREFLEEAVKMLCVGSEI